MTAEVIQLRAGPTEAQLRRVRAWAETELAGPTRRDGHSLCQDLAHFTHQIDVAAYLVGALRPSANKDGIGDDLDLAFQKLYEGAESLMFKAMDEYPVTQGLGRKRRNRKKQI